MHATRLIASRGRDDRAAAQATCGWHKASHSASWLPRASRTPISPASRAGTRQPSVKALRRLAAKLGVTADFLETGSQLGPEEHRELRLADLELAMRLDDPANVEEQLEALLEESLAAGDSDSALRAPASHSPRRRSNGRTGRLRL